MRNLVATYEHLSTLFSLSPSSLSSSSSPSSQLPTSPSKTSSSSPSPSTLLSTPTSPLNPSLSRHASLQSPAPRAISQEQRISHFCLDPEGQILYSVSDSLLLTATDLSHHAPVPQNTASNQSPEANLQSNISNQPNGRSNDPFSSSDEETETVESSSISPSSPSSSRALPENRFFSQSHSNNSASTGAQGTGWTSDCASLLDQDALSETRPVGISFVPDLSSVVIALSSGHLITVSTETTRDPSTKTVLPELVGAFDAGLSGMSWSPDGDVVVLTTPDDMMLLMSSSFEQLAFEDLTVLPSDVNYATDLGMYHTPEKHVKALIDTDAAQLGHDHTKDNVAISWRGDGAYFAISSRSPPPEDIKDPSSIPSRHIRIFERSGELHSVSEHAKGLDFPLAWKPSGAVIASPQAVSTPAGYRMAFFERNGLRNGGFFLAPLAGTITSIAWSPGSELLAVVAGSTVRVWAASNYQWDIKWELSLPSTNGSPLIAWTQNNTKTLTIVSPMTHTVRTVKFAFTTTISSGPIGTHLSTAWVCAGAVVRATPLAAAVIPPPMSAYTWAPYRPAPDSEEPLPPSIIGFDAWSNSVAALRSDGVLVIGEWAPGARRSPLKPPYSYDEWHQPPEPVQKLDLPAITNLPGPASHTGFTLRSPTWVGPDIIVLIAASTNPGAPHDVLVTLILDPNPTVRPDVTFTPLEGAVTVSAMTRLGHALEADPRLVVQTSDGAMYTFSPREPSSSLRLARRYVLPTAATTIKAVVRSEGEEVIVAHANSRLYIDELAVLTDATSFVLTPEFVLATTYSRHIRVIPLAGPIVPISPLPATSGPTGDLASRRKYGEAFDDSVRAVERGAEFVAAIAGDCRVVLQMPRGNLEVIAPRALVLASIREYLDNRDYSRAFDLMRTHRIDTNLLHDHNPDAFLADADVILAQIDDVDRINLFLGSLRGDDVTVTMYAAPSSTSIPVPTSPKSPTSVAIPGSPGASWKFSPRRATSAGALTPRSAGSSVMNPQNAVARPPGKVNSVCRVVRHAALAAGREKWLLSILTASIRKDPPDLEEALKDIIVLRDTGSEDIVDEALKYLVFLIDVDALFNEALGMYDFDLVTLIAQYSNKDPKEYVPFLTELKALAPVEQRFRIDTHLARFDKSVRSLAADPSDEAFARALEVVKDHRLYDTALELWASSDSRRQAVLSAYAEDLANRNQHSDAAMLHVRAGNNDAAIESYASAGEPDVALALARSASWSADQLQGLAVKASAVLRGASRYPEAAAVLAGPGKDPEAGVEALCEGGLWHEAWSLAIEHSRADLLETHIVPGASSMAEQLIDDTDRVEASYMKARKRLEALHKEKVTNAVALAIGHQGYSISGTNLELALGEVNPRFGPDATAVPVDDMFSETGSTASGLSGITIGSTSTWATAATSPSQRGGPKRHMRVRKDKRRVREGNPEEEKHLVELMRKEIPSPAAQTRVGRLVQFLALHGQEEDARRLQVRFSAWLKTIAEALPPLPLPQVEAHTAAQVESARNDPRSYVLNTAFPEDRLVQVSWEVRMLNKHVDQVAPTSQPQSQ